MDHITVGKVTNHCKCWAFPRGRTWMEQQASQGSRKASLVPGVTVNNRGTAKSRHSEGSATPSGHRE